MRTCATLTMILFLGSFAISAEAFAEVDHSSPLPVEMELLNSETRGYVHTIFAKREADIDYPGLEFRIDEALDKNIHSFDLVLLDRMDRLMVYFLERMAEGMAVDALPLIAPDETLPKDAESAWVSLLVRQQQYGYLWGRVWTDTALIPVVYSEDMAGEDQINKVYRALLDRISMMPEQAIEALPRSLRQILVLASLDQLTTQAAKSIHNGNPTLASNMFLILLQIASEGTWYAKQEHLYAVAQGAIADDSRLITVDFYRAQARGDLEAAARALNRALRINPQDHTAWDMLGNVEFAMGRTAEALEAFGQAIDLAPDYAHTYYDRGSVYLHLERYAKALHDLRKAVALDPSYSEFRTALGSALNHLGRYDEAVAHLEQAVHLNGTSTVARFSLGVTYRHLGRVTESDEQWEWILTNAPTSYEARQLRSAGVVIGE